MSRLDTSFDCCSFFFFFNDTATTEIYTLSLHDALPISLPSRPERSPLKPHPTEEHTMVSADRKSTRLNSSHTVISYAVFCLKKKNHQSQVKEMSHRVASQVGRYGSSAGSSRFERLQCLI